jgi:hypothetical protein
VLGMTREAVVTGVLKGCVRESGIVGGQGWSSGLHPAGTR